MRVNVSSSLRETAQLYSLYEICLGSKYVRFAMEVKEAKEGMIARSWRTRMILNDPSGHCKVWFCRSESETLERKNSNSEILSNSRLVVLEEIHLQFYMKKEDRSFFKTLFDQLSLSGLWHAFHRVNWWHGSLKEYRGKKCQRKKRWAHRVSYQFNGIERTKQWEQGNSHILWRWSSRFRKHASSALTFVLEHFNGMI